MIVYLTPFFNGSDAFGEDRIGSKTCSFVTLQPNEVDQFGKGGSVPLRT